MKRPLSLGTRLALAFGGLFLAVSAGSAMLVAWRAGAAAESLYVQRMERLVRGLSDAGFGVNRDLLAKMRGVLGCHVASFDPASSELLSSCSGQLAEQLRKALLDTGRTSLTRDPEVFVPGPISIRLGSKSNSGVSVRRVQVFGSWQRLVGRRRLVLLLVPQEEISRVRNTVVVPAALAALLGAVAAVILAWLLAASVSRPVRRLARQAGRVAGGNFEFHHLAGGAREIEELSLSLESMTAALAASRQELVRSERSAAAGQMAAALAHEVRNPLTGAKMTLEMLLAEEQRPETAEELSAVLEELKRLQMVVDEMVSFARPAAPVFSEVDIAAVLAQVLQLLGRQLEHAHIEVKVEGPENKLLARADANKVKQVLVNLLLNAIQAQPTGGQVVIRLAQGNPDRVVIEVCDQGRGVDPADLEKIFVPFFTTKQSGAGLGLAVSRSIAEEHQGCLSCSLPEEGGSCFRLELQAWSAERSC
jgi:signal transduction histidine kinase